VLVPVRREQGVQHRRMQQRRPLGEPLRCLPDQLPIEQSKRVKGGSSDPFEMLRWNDTARSEELD